MDRALALRLEGLKFDSNQGNIPQLHSQSSALVGVHVGDSWSMYLSDIDVSLFYLFPFLLSLKINRRMSSRRGCTTTTERVNLLVTFSKAK